MPQYRHVAVSQDDIGEALVVVDQIQHLLLELAQQQQLDPLVTAAVAAAATKVALDVSGACDCDACTALVALVANELADRYNALDDDIEIPGVQP